MFATRPLRAAVLVQNKPAHVDKHARPVEIVREQRLSKLRERGLWQLILLHNHGLLYDRSRSLYMS